MKSFVSLILALLATQATGLSIVNPYNKLYQQVAYRTLGLEVEKRHPNTKILLIDYSSRMPLHRDPFRSGLRTAQIQRVLTVAFPWPETKCTDCNVCSKEPAPPPPDLTGFLVAKDLDEILFRTDCDLVVSFVGLPHDFHKMRYWQEKKQKELPPLVLASPCFYKLRGAIRQSCVTILLAHKPVKYDPCAPLPPTEAEAFNKRYLLITPDNVDEVHAQFPRLFEGDAPEPTGISLDVTHGANTPFELPEPSEPQTRWDWILVVIAVNVLAIFVAIVWNRKSKA